ncbi:MAG: right-handed parallel beta-helix repeat-containing protein [Actinomycetota bacterium]|nr:right-handed parallel beta-helix repeat-containing protein [Actinomycetota bacterium]
MTLAVAAFGIAVASPTSSVAMMPTDDVQPGLFYSATPDRANAKPLEGATLSGKVYIFAVPSGSVYYGTFYLDGVKQRVENNAPYDFRGSDPSLTPRAWDSAGDEGSHVISFSGQLRSGPTYTATASFRVGTTTGTPSPAPQPRPGDGTRPGPTNTGVPEGTALGVRDSITVTRPGAVLDRLDIRGSVVIKAPNVVIRRSKIHGSGTGLGVRVMSGGSVTIEDSEIYKFQVGIGYSNWTARRVDIHSMTADGVKLGDDATLERSYVHHLTPAPGAHADGAQLESAGAENVVVRGNTIDLANPGVNSGYGGNSAIILKPDLGTLDAGGVLVEGNYLNGGNYTLYLVNSEDRQLRNVTIRDNRWGRVHRYGPNRVTTPCLWTNNVWDDTGAPVSR